MTSRAEQTIEEIDRLVARERASTSPRGPARDEMIPDPSKKDALRDAARAIESIGAMYALIGGIAVGIHANFPRATHDVDVAVLSTVLRDAARRALEAVGSSFRGDFRHTLKFRDPSGGRSSSCSRRRSTRPSSARSGSTSTAWPSRS